MHKSLAFIAKSETIKYAKANKRNMNLSEVRLWMILRKSEYNFRRQQTIGNYIVDFASLSNKLLIEIDGVTHESKVEYDKFRIKYLIDTGYRVLVFRCMINYPDQIVYDSIWSIIKDFLSSNEKYREVY